MELRFFVFLLFTSFFSFKKSTFVCVPMCVSCTYGIVRYDMTLVIIMCATFYRSELSRRCTFYRTNVFWGKESIDRDECHKIFLLSDQSIIYAYHYSDNGRLFPLLLNEYMRKINGRRTHKAPVQTDKKRTYTFFLAGSTFSRTATTMNILSLSKGFVTISLLLLFQSRWYL